MTLSSEPSTVAQIHQLLAENGYEVSDVGNEVLRLRDPDTGISFQAALHASVLYMSVTLITVAQDAITPEVMRTMLSAENGISTSAFQLYDAAEGRVAITLNNFCTLQNMGPEDHDDILSLAGYLMADLIEARNLLEGSLAGSSAAKANS